MRNTGEKMKKKIICLGLVCLMFAMMLTGCASNGGTDKKTARAADELVLAIGGEPDLSLIHI